MDRLLAYEAESRRRNSTIRWRLSVTAGFVAATVGLSTTLNNAGTRSSRPRAAHSVTAPPTTTMTTLPKIARPKTESPPKREAHQQSEFGPQPTTGSIDGYLTCATAPATMESGDTVYSLVTVGLDEGDSFSNDVYEFNLESISEQSQTNPALDNPNSISIGQSFKILNQCIEYEPVVAFSSAPSDTFRWVSYQDYSGSDGRVHNDVGVSYSASATTGQLIAVDGCQPDPECYDYVSGVPSPTSS